MVAETETKSAHSVCGALILASEITQLAIRNYMNKPNASSVVHLEQSLEVLHLATIDAKPARVHTLRAL